MDLRTVSIRSTTLRRIEKLVAALPGKPLPDSVVQHAGRERAQIATLYRSIGDDDSAADWYRRGAEGSYECSDILGAVVLVKQSLKLRPNVPAVRNLYAQLWKSAGLGDTPDPVV